MPGSPGRNDYVRLGQQFAGHGHTNHGAGEYVSRFNPKVHTNTVEGFFSIFKRGMRGVYQHASKRHLHRYLAEFDFRYSNRVALGVNDVTREYVRMGHHHSNTVENYFSILKRGINGTFHHVSEAHLGSAPPSACTARSRA